MSGPYTQPLVYFFGQGRGDGTAAMKEILGGKGAGLAEMTKAGLPTPPEFTITTEACNDYFAAGEQLPEGLWEDVLEAVKEVERRTGKGFGDPKNPLLVSVRSGAKFSMPHMIAATLVYGSADAASFAPAALADPRVARLRERVRLVRYEGDMTPPFDRPARLVIALAGGARRIAECRSARGGPDRLLSEAELRDKIARLSSPVLPGLTQLVDGADGDADRPWRAVLEAMA